MSDSDDIFDAVKNGDVDTLTSLITSGVDVNIAGKNGIQPLHQAAFYGQDEIARLLIQSGANIQGRDAFGRTPLHWAKKPGVARILMQCGADIDDSDNEGNTPLDMTISKEVYTVMMAKYANDITRS